MKRMQPSRQTQRGAATLVVVMVLFFIMAMMAAYANRNLVFEQRIANNYFRSGMAAEMAEAGAEWTIERLNSGLVDATCVDSSSGLTSFRDRYLNIADDRTIAPLLSQTSAVAACIATASNGWVCQCPADGTITTPNVAAAAVFQPMFGVTLKSVSRAGVMRLSVNSCTDTLANCANNDSASSVANATGLANGQVTIDLALLSALKVPPASPLTVRGSVDLGSPGLGLHNAEVSTGGLLMQIGNTYTGSLARATSLPGSSTTAAVVSEDSSLSSISAERMFANFLGMAPTTYREQPATRSISCSGDCSATVATAIASGAHMIWVDGPLTLSSNVTLGAADNPVLIFAAGDVTLDGPMLINGLLYARGNASWSNSSSMPALLTGALIAEGDFSASGAVDLLYSRSVLNFLSNRRGSFVRVPASWTDGS